MNTTARCPTCGRPPEPAFRPFCSKRCSNVDLQRWLSDRYAIPGQAEEDGDSPPAPED